MALGTRATLPGRLAIGLAVLCVTWGCAAPVALGHRVSSEAQLRAALAAGDPIIELTGTIGLSRALEIPEGVTKLEIRGVSTLRVQPGFQGRAVIDAGKRSNLTLLDFTIDGARPDRPDPIGLPPSNLSFARFYKRNGIILEGGENIRIENIRLSSVTDFAIIASGVKKLRLTGVTIEDSGSVNEHGRNNTSGGILLEEGTSDFEVRNCTLRRVRGNAIWTHSNAEPRSARGIIAGNTVSEVARDAIQVGHATEVRVEANIGDRIGYPIEFVDAEAHGTPVALDTAGNVDRSVYRDNRFRDVNGECINLDGFHHGEVLRNVCDSTGPFTNYPFAHYGIVMGNSDPGMESQAVTITGNRITGTGYGGLYLIGTGHTVTGNRFLMLNRAGCTGDGRTARCNYALDQPDMLRSGIYLAAFSNRKSRTEGNTIRDNELRGFGMGRWCVTAAPGLALKDNRVGDNTCIEDSGKR